MGEMNPQWTLGMPTEEEQPSGMPQPGAEQPPLPSPEAADAMTPQPTAVPASDQVAVDAETGEVVPEDIETAQALTGQTEVSEIERLLSFGPADAIGPELHAQLMARANKSLSLTEAVGLAGLALADPDSARRIMEQMDEDKRGAQETLARLSESVTSFKKTALIQDMQGRRQAEALKHAQALQDEKYQLISNQQIVGQRLADLGNHPAIPRMPKLTDDASVQQWLLETQPMIAETAAAEDITKETLAALSQGFGADPEDVKTAFLGRMALAGVDPKRAEQLYQSRSRQFEYQIKQNRTASEIANDLNRKRMEVMDAQVAKLMADANKIEKALESGSPEDVRAAAATYAAMVNDYAKGEQRLEQLREENRIWLGYKDQGSPIQLNNLEYLKNQIAAQEQIQDQLGPMLETMRQRMLPYSDLLNVTNTYEMEFNRALEYVMGSHPELAANPALLMQSITMGGVGDALKQEFWSTLFSSLRRKYPDLTLRQVQQMLEDEAMERMQEINPQAPGSTDVLRPGEAEPMWMKTAPPPGAKSQGNPMFETLPRLGFRDRITQGVKNFLTGEETNGTPDPARGN